MDVTSSIVSHAAEIYARAETSKSGRPPVYKAVGISLAVASGLFIGVSFVLKKIGLLKANVKYNEEAGEGYGYLKNFWWWAGMILMIVGEICNFVAYAFVDAILVTPLGALSVVITTILSAIFLKERLSFVGKVGCFSCIVGSVVIALNAPEQSSVNNIQEMQHYVIAPGFLSYAGVIIAGAIFTALWAGPRYGKKSMFVYLSICSLVGGLSVVATQGLGSAILAQINGEKQFNQWFLYVLFAFVVATLLTEIIYLNKALNIFNAALVTPTYYVIFTTATIVTSAILFRGFKGTPVQITTVILGFLQICAGVVLLQLSKSAKDVPDAAVFKGDLDQLREVAAQEEPETEPKADSIRGTAAIIRRLSTPRRHMEAEEARRYFREKQEDQLKPPAENEIIEWDGLRRRKTVIGEGPTMVRPRTPRTPSTKKSFPPLGMSRFPEEQEAQETTVDRRPSTRQSSRSFLDEIRSRTSSILHPRQWKPIHGEDDTPMHPVALDSISVGPNKTADTSYHGPQLQPPFQPRIARSDTSRSVSWADGAQSPDRDSNLSPGPPTDGARRQFSFNSVFNRVRSGTTSPIASPVASPPRGILRSPHVPGAALQTVTEEERLGLVKGDSRSTHGEEDKIGNKLERMWSSSSSGSSVGAGTGLMKEQRYGRGRQPSVSSATTSAPPPYDNQHDYYYTNAESEYIYPSSRLVMTPSEIEETEDGWQVPVTRPIGPSTINTAPAPVPPVHMQSPSSRPRRLSDEVNPAVAPVSAGPGSGNSSYMRVLHTPSPSNSEELGVMSISSSSTDSGNRLGRRESGWRRPGSVSSSNEERSVSGTSKGRGAFI